MLKFLFIGGSRDGQLIDVPEDRRLAELEVRQERVKGRRLAHPAPTELYERMEFCGEPAKFHVFALRGLSGDVVLRALIACYTPPTRELQT